MIKIEERSLKYIAAFAMLCDHFAHAVPGWDYYSYPALIFHCIGATAAPIFFYMLAKGYRRTRSFPKYAGRLLLFACISYFPFIMFFTGKPENIRDYFRFNVIFLMFFSLILLKILHEEKDLFCKIYGIIICVLFISLSDWGIMGLAYILIFDYFHDNKKGIIFAGIIISIINLHSRFFWFFEPSYNYDYNFYLHDKNTQNGLIYAVFQFIPFLLIYLANSQKNMSNKPRKSNNFERWFFYIFYPAHLALLYFMEYYEIIT